MIINIEIPDDSCRNCCLLHKINKKTCLGSPAISYYCGRMKKEIILRSLETNLCYPNNQFPDLGDNWHVNKDKPEECYSEKVS